MNMDSVAIFFLFYFFFSWILILRKSIDNDIDFRRSETLKTKWAHIIIRNEIQHAAAESMWNVSYLLQFDLFLILPDP